MQFNFWSATKYLEGEGQGNNFTNTNLDNTTFSKNQK